MALGAALDDGACFRGLYSATGIQSEVVVDVEAAGVEHRALLEFDVRGDVCRWREFVLVEQALGGGAVDGGDPDAGLPSTTTPWT